MLRRRCKLITDNERCGNIVSRVLVNHLKLFAEPYPNAYTVGWIKKGPSVKLIKIVMSLFY